MGAHLRDADGGAEENGGLHVQVRSFALRVIEDWVETVGPDAAVASTLRAPVDISIPLLAILQGANTCGSAMRAFGRLLEDAVLREQLDECKRALVEEHLHGASPLFFFFSALLGGLPMPDIRDFDERFLFHDRRRLLEGAGFATLRSWPCRGR